MSDKDLRDLCEAMMLSVQATVATDDMLALLCIHFAAAEPEPAASMLRALKNMRESEAINRSDAFVALSRRIEQALSGNLDLKFLSLEKQDPIEPTVQALLARFRRS